MHDAVEADEEQAQADEGSLRKTNERVVTRFLG
jgi:hypothetical protein